MKMLSSRFGDSTIGAKVTMEMVARGIILDTY